MSENNDNTAANWQERLTKTRRLRGQPKGATSVDPVPPADEQISAAGDADLISVEDVLKTANLNDRMELARVRHAQILARRKTKTGPPPTTQETQKKRRDAFRFAQAKQTSPDADIPVMAPPISIPIEQSDPPPLVQTEPEKQPTPPVKQAPLLPPRPSQKNEEPVEEEQPEKKRRGFAAVWAVLAVAAVLAFFLFEPARNILFPDTSAGQLAQSEVGNQGGTIVVEQIVPPTVSTANALQVPGPVLFSGEMVPPMQTFDLADLSNEILVPKGYSVPIRPVRSVVTNADIVRDVAPGSALGAPVPIYVAVPVVKVSDSPVSDSPISTAGLGVIPDLELPENWGKDIAAALRPPHAAISVASYEPRDVGPIAIARSSVFGLPAASPLSPPARQANPEGLKLLLLPEAPNRGLARLAGNATFTPAKFQFPVRINNIQGAIVPPSSASLGINVSAPLPFDNPVAEGRFNVSSLMVHAPASIQKSSLDSLLSGLSENGFDPGTPRTFSFTIQTTNVRYFHAADAEAAKAVSDVVGGIARDFTSFKPSPPLGTLELWLAGNAAPRPVVRQNTGGSTAPNPSLLNLRNRLIESLKAGDHL